MAALPFSFSKILVKAPTDAAAFAGGLAVAPALAPIVQDLVNFTWSEHPSKALDLLVAAEVAAEDVGTYADMEQEAGYHGYNPERFAWAYGLTLNAPGSGLLLEMLRRKTISGDDFTHGLRKAKLETRWDAGLTDLQHARIPVADLAYMVVRGLVNDAGLLPVAPPASGDKIARYPVAGLDTLAEASSWGWDEDRFRALVGRSGLSMAPVAAAQAYYRGIIGLDDFYLAIAEGDLRNEWRDAILAVSRQIPSSLEFVEGELRGYITTAERLAGTARHGMAQADSDLLFAIAGRPLNVHAITTGLARGGKYGGGYDTVPEPYQDAIRRSAIRPEYADLAYANRYNYPSAFVIRSLATSGEIDEPTTHQILLDIGWPPDLVDKVVVAWFGGTTAAADPNVKKAETKAWTEAQNSYIAAESTAQDVAPILTTLGVPPAAQTEITGLWDQIRTLRRKQLSPAEIKKAAAEGVPNPATGAPWTQTDALAALAARGYSDADARTLLEL